MEATRGKQGRAPLVVLDGLRIQVLRAIEFDDEFFGEANKINDVRADCCLPTKFAPAQILGAQEVP